MLVKTWLCWRILHLQRFHKAARFPLILVGLLLPSTVIGGLAHLLDAFVGHTFEMYRFTHFELCSKAFTDQSGFLSIPSTSILCSYVRTNCRNTSMECWEFNAKRIQTRKQALISVCKTNLWIFNILFILYRKLGFQNVMLWQRFQENSSKIWSVYFKDKVTWLLLLCFIAHRQSL